MEQAHSTSSGQAPVATGIPVAHLPLVWRDLWPLIEPAYRRSHEKEDLPLGLAVRRLQLWAIYQGGVPIAAVVTRLNRHLGSGDLDCRIWLVGGRDLTHWLGDFLAKLIPWARAEGCACLSGSGRKGWTRIARQLGCVPDGEEGGDTVWRHDL